MIKKLNIKARLIVSFVIVTIIASVAGILSIFIMKDMDTNYSEAIMDYGFAQGDIGRAMNLITDNRRLVRDIISLDNKEKIEADVQQIDINRKKYDEYAVRIEESLVNEEAKQAYAEIEKRLEEYQVLQDEMIQFGLKAKAEEKAALLEKAMGEIDPVYDELYAAYNRIMDIKVNLGDELSARLSRRANWSIGIVMTLVSIATLVGVVVGVKIAKGISKPVIKCVKRLNQLAAGDLRSEVPQVSTNDEIKVLADATAEIVGTMTNIVDDMRNGLQEIAKGNFQAQSQAPDMYIGDYNPLFVAIEKIADELSVLMAEVNDSSDQVALSSGQVSDASQSLSQGATEQASSVEELSATLEELSEKITANAKHAENAKIETEQVDMQIGDSNRQMQSMIEAMNRISDKSNEIGKIIKTIDDIAFQTNILALNAAVEAARAGEAGKGFAVVADEVRNLAGKSAEAAKNTEALIEETVEAVEQGAAMADNTAKSMMTVVEGAEKITAIVEQISAASNEQAGSVGQVTRAVEQISNVVQNNAATAEESAASSETLNGQAQNLKKLVGRFKVRESAVMGAVAASIPKASRKPSAAQQEPKPERTEPKVRLSKPAKRSKPIVRRQPEENAEIVMPEEHIPEFVEPEVSVPKASFSGGFNSSFDKY